MKNYINIKILNKTQSEENLKDQNKTLKFDENINIKNETDTFEQNAYEKNIKRNFASSIREKLISAILSLNDN